MSVPSHDILPIVATVCGSGLVVGVTAIIANTIAKLRRGRQSGEELDEERLRELERRVEALEHLNSQSQEEITRLREDGKFLRRLLENRSHDSR